jgi:hypothetical protein
MLVWIDTDGTGWRVNQCLYDRNQDPDVSTDTDYGDGFVGVRIGVRGCTEYADIFGIPTEVQTDNKRNEAGYAFNQVYGWAGEILPCGPYHIRPHLRVNGQVTLYSVITVNNGLTDEDDREVYAGFNLQSIGRVYYNHQIISSYNESVLYRRVSANDNQLIVPENAQFETEDPYYLPSLEFVLEGGGILQVTISIEMTVFSRGHANRAYCHAIDDINGLFRIETGGMQVHQC